MKKNQAKVILFISQKGGSAKTTNIINLATASMFHGARNVMILDCDPQRSAALWQDDNREELINRYEYVLPQVVAPAQGVMPSTIINSLIDKLDEIWIDTAGFVGYQQDTAQVYLHDILPFVDLIITPLKSSKFDLNATKDTMSYLNQVSHKINLDIPKLLLPSDIKGGEKGISYLHNMLVPVLAQPENSKWCLFKTYIPFSGLFVKAHERGGNAFIPRKIEKVTEAYVSALLEIREHLGVTTESEKRDALQEIISNLQVTRQNASKEKIQDELEDQE